MLILVTYDVSTVEAAGRRAFVVPADARTAGWQVRVVAALRERVDPAFVPRRVVAVAALPREPGTGKLPALAFGAWAAAQLAREPTR